MAQEPEAGQRRLAVVAHYDAAGEVTPVLKDLLTTLATLCETIVIVSTGLSDHGAAELEPFGPVIRRPNLGYDFASWSTGLNYARTNFDLNAFDQIITVNDSFYQLRDGALADAIGKMNASDGDIWGLTASHQTQFHLQSFCLVFQRSAFLNRWFDVFWSSVWDYGTRDYVIETYELYLARSAAAAGLRIASVFDTHRVQAIHAYDKHLNPMSRHWRHVAADIGIAKVELLRTNPHDEDLSGLDAIAAPTRLTWILAHAKRRPSSPAQVLNPLDEAALAAASSRASIAVHIHLHYADLLDELMLAARRIPVPADIYITTTIEDDLAIVVERAKRHDRDCRILQVPNAGRDIGPFLALLNAGVFEPYALVCKVHSKKSAYSDKGTFWRRSLIGSVLGSSTQILDVIDAFRNRPTLGLVGPERSFVRDNRHWGANRETVTALARQIDPRYRDAEVPLAFPAGSMYWLRPGAFAPLRGLDLRSEAFGPENGAQDGTLAHAIERLTAIAAWTAGYEVTTTDELQSSLELTGQDNAVIPVL